MTQESFKSIKFFEADGMLDVFRVGDQPVVFAMETSYGKGLCVSLEASEIADFITRVQKKVSGEIRKNAFSLIHTNRGDPYREGIEIQIGNWETEFACFFVERDRLPELCTFLEDALKAQELIDDPEPTL